MSDYYAVDDPLYGWSHARNSDPATSHAAVPRNITAQAFRVLHAYASGEAMLDHTAYRLVGLDDDGNRLAHQRCTDLRTAKFIERTGKRGITPSGNKGDLCRITQRGLNYLHRLPDVFA